MQKINELFQRNECHDRNLEFCTDLAPMRPVGMSPMQRTSQVGYVARDAQQQDQSDTLDLLEEDLNRLTVAVSFTRQEEILVRLQWHTTGAGGRFSHVLRKISQAVVCYSEHHHDE